MRDRNFARPLAAALALGAVMNLSFVAQTQARSAPAHPSRTMYAAPDVCQVIEDTGQLITIPWLSEGCNADRESFRAMIAAHRALPGRYPPLTCVANGARFLWNAPSCTHARNRYAAGAIKPVYFGRR